MVMDLRVPQNIGKFFSVTEQLAASQEGLTSMELVSSLVDDAVSSLEHISAKGRMI
jgi:hypothetical protein